jgi:hypothetical protein
MKRLLGENARPFLKGKIPGHVGFARSAVFCGTLATLSTAFPASPSRNRLTCSLWGYYAPPSRLQKALPTDYGLHRYNSIVTIDFVTNVKYTL